MSLSLEVFVVLALILLYIDILIILKLLINRLKNLGIQQQFINEKQELIKAFSSENNNKRISRIPDSYKKMKQSILLDKQKIEGLEECLDFNKSVRKNILRLKSSFKLKRMDAAVQLSFVASDKEREALEKAIAKEKSFPVKLYFANALSDIGCEKSIPVLISTLINSHRWYRDRVNMLIADFGDAFHNYLPQIINRNEHEIKELIVDFASICFSAELKNYLIDIVNDNENEIPEYKGKYAVMDDFGPCCGNCIFGRTFINEGSLLCKYNGPVSPNFKCRRFKIIPVNIGVRSNKQELVYKAAEVLANLYPKVLEQEKYQNSTDIIIRNIAIKALSRVDSHESINKLVSFLKNKETAKASVDGISELIGNKPELIQRIINIFDEEKNLQIKPYLAEILSRKIDYFIMKLMSRDKKSASDIIEQVLLSGKTSNVIDFLNRNKNIDIENELIAIIKNVFPKDLALEKQFCRYLNERLSKKCGLIRCDDILSERIEKKDGNIIRTLYSVILIVLLIFPIIYAVRYITTIFTIPYFKQLMIYVVDFNYYLAFYSIAINLIYIILLVLSFINVRRQSKLWKLKSMSLLFKKRMLPSISIIAPAYNEEKTIIESTNSLLNLIYPDYELIIVNDGSKDATMDILIRNFDLKRVDYVCNYKINTKQVRGIYMNPSMTKLIVVDKVNGGKADSLNAGINISSKEYFCGIDADSLLESDALLKLASMELDAGVETPALGGNIFPINGCTIDQGAITSIEIPKNKLARFQTIEYIRAFMAGRLGWAYSNSLLIISGAFGLFRKERVISVGGYLTSSGKYEKDTVGEDMELVVRIARFMREKGLKYKIDYAYNANCWTEVPEDLRSLKKQRYRWHRGLIDILTFHKKMLINPSYGRAGLIAMPYFFIFEMVGPLIEIQGYLMVLFAFLLGLLNPELALLLFISTVLMGVLVSLCSVLISQKDREYFKIRDIAILILYSILENFGPRQLFSFWRVVAVLRMLRKEEGWGKVERKGFAVPGAAVKG